MLGEVIDSVPVREEGTARTTKRAKRKDNSEIKTDKASSRKKEARKESNIILIVCISCLAINVRSNTYQNSNQAASLLLSQ